MTSAIPTFCVVCQDGALCWRNCRRSRQGGAGDFRFYVVSVRTEMSTLLPYIKKNPLSSLTSKRCVFVSLPTHFRHVLGECSHI